MGDLADDYAEALEDGFGRPVDVLGVSTGGSLALQHAADRPGLVRTLVVAGADYRLSQYGGVPAARDTTRAAAGDRRHQISRMALSAGLSNALALSASYLDIIAERHRSSVLGIKESAAALSAVAGPLLVAFASPFTTPGEVFAASGIVALVAIVLSLVAPRGVRPPERAEIREELPDTAMILHDLACAVEDAVPAGTASVAGIDEQITISTPKGELP